MFDSTRGPIGVVKRRCARRFWHVALREVSGAIDGSVLRAWRDRWVVAPCVARSMGRCSVRGAIDGSLLRAWRDRWVVAPCVARSMGRRSVRGATLVYSSLLQSTLVYSSLF